MSEISIIVKPTAGGQKFSISGIAAATTIAELKEKARPGPAPHPWAEPNNSACCPRYAQLISRHAPLPVCRIPTPWVLNAGRG